MADQIWPFEGLPGWMYAALFGLNENGAQLAVDVILAPAPPYGLGNTYAATTLGVVSAAFTAASANAGGANFLAPGDFAVLPLAGSVQILQAFPVTFTNITGGDVTVLGTAMYSAQTINQGSASGPPLLYNIQELPAGPTVVPNGGTIILPVFIGDLSQLSS